MRAWFDGRVPGREKYILSAEEPDLMLIPDEVRSCVAFIGFQTPEGEFKAGGTCFFIGRRPEAPWPNTGAWNYAVTARHVVDGAALRGDGKVLMRLNAAVSGEPTLVQSDRTDWFIHPTDSTVDVAVLRYAPSLSEFDYKLFPLDGSIDSQNKFQVGLGDEVFLTGLFTQHIGRSRNIPIVRTGTIAAMREERVIANIGLGQYAPIDAYLVETRSIGGLSGSPVFAYYSGQMRGGGSYAGMTYYLLGMMQGHYDMRPAICDEAESDGLTEERINTGIGIALPIECIKEVILQPEILKRDKQDQDALLSRIGPIADDPS